jgi:hypothetical protein
MSSDDSQQNSSSSTSDDSTIQQLVFSNGSPARGPGAIARYPALHSILVDGHQVVHEPNEQDLISIVGSFIATHEPGYRAAVATGAP